jgi:predicted  nucleic acid-binding Zn-ribbon protein
MALNEDVLKLTTEVNKRQHLEDQLQTLDARMKDLRSVLRGLKEGHTPLQAEQHELSTQLDTQRAEANAKDSTVSEKVRSMLITALRHVLPARRGERQHSV